MAVTLRFNTLYKKSQTGKIQTWNIFCEDDNTYTVIHGQEFGAKQVNKSSVIQGKNIGKKNETSPQQQCELEAMAKWKKQQERKGYSETKTAAGEKQFMPMLAKSYKDMKHKVVFPAAIQGKLDGGRFFLDCENAKIMSRQLKEFDLFQDIALEVANSVGRGSGLILDGELYVHEKLSFQDIMGGIKRKEKNENTDLIELWIYDIFDKSQPDLAYEDRFALLKSKLEPVSKNNARIKILEYSTVNSHEEIADHFNKHLESLFEGSIVRNLAGAYKPGGRSEDLLKVKAFQDEEFEIVGVKPATGKFEGMCSFICSTGKGSTFDVMPKGSEEQRRQYLKDWNSGKIKPGDKMTVEFFEWTTSDSPEPRFPVGKGIRNYE